MRQIKEFNINILIIFSIVVLLLWDYHFIFAFIYWKLFRIAYKSRTEAIECVFSEQDRDPARRNLNCILVHPNSGRHAKFQCHPFFSRADFRSPVWYLIKQYFLRRKTSSEVEFLPPRNYRNKYLTVLSEGALAI